MEAEDGDVCGTHNLSVDDRRELRDIVARVVDSAGADAATLLPTFTRTVSTQPASQHFVHPGL